MKLNRKSLFYFAAAVPMILCFVEVMANAPESENSVPITSRHDPISRDRRQTYNSNRGIFSLIGQYLGETRDETVRTYNQIVKLISSQIVPMARGIQFNHTDPAINREIPENGTTRNTSYLLTQEEFYRILNRNLRGLARLFNRESRRAIQDSNRNVRLLRKQFMEVVKPFVVSNSTT